MGAIDETRKVLQDFLAPEIREIKSRLDALERRFDATDRKIDDVAPRDEFLEFMNQPDRRLEGGGFHFFHIRFDFHAPR